MKNNHESGNRLLLAISKAVFVTRARCGFTQEQLALKIGTKQSGIARLENSKAFPSFRLVQKVADALDQNIVFRFEPKQENDPRFVRIQKAEPMYAVTSGLLHKPEQIIYDFSPVLTASYVANPSSHSVSQKSKQIGFEYQFA